MTDRWCPNCQQRVAPVRPVGRLPTLVGWTLLVVLWIVANPTSADPTLMRTRLVMLVVVGVPILTWLLMRQLLTRDRCPLCRTTRLTSGPAAPA